MRKSILCMLAILASFAGGMLLEGFRSGNRIAFAQPPLPWNGRKFYVTKTGFTGDKAATAACAAGYHMASLWEIYDPSSLEYDTSLGFMSSDSGSGPPSTIYGWVRTGYDSYSSTVDSSGHANCNAWTSKAANVSGTAVHLNQAWRLQTLTLTSILPWVPESGGPGNPSGFSPPACSTTQNVWCVQN